MFGNVAGTSRARPELEIAALDVVAEKREPQDMIETILTLIYPVALGLLLGAGCQVWERLNRGRRARARLERYIDEGRQG